MKKKNKKKKEETSEETYLSKLFYEVFGRWFKPRVKINKMIVKIKQSGKPGPPPY